MKKEYTNPSRKPMMTGGQANANADTQSRIATGRATRADKAAAEKQRREELNRMSTEDLRKVATGNSDDASIAVSILRERGVEGAMPPGDPEGGMMYGGKAKKKMYGGRAK